MHIHATVQHLIHSIKRWKICAYPLCMTGWVPVGVVGPWPFADRVEEKMCSPQLLQHSDVQKAYARAIQPVGCSGGAGQGGPDVWTPQSNASTVAVDDTTYPRGRTRAWCTGWCTGGFDWCVSVCCRAIMYETGRRREGFLQSSSAKLEPESHWMCLDEKRETKVSSSAWNTVRWVSTHLTILSLLYLMNYSTQDAIREGDCFLSAISTEYTV